MLFILLKRACNYLHVDSIFTTNISVGIANKKSYPACDYFLVIKYHFSVLTLIFGSATVMVSARAEAPSERIRQSPKFKTSMLFAFMSAW